MVLSYFPKVAMAHAGSLSLSIPLHCALMVHSFDPPFILF